MVFPSARLKPKLAGVIVSSRSIWPSGCSLTWPGSVSATSAIVHFMPSSSRRPSYALRDGTARPTTLHALPGFRLHAARPAPPHRLSGDHAPLHPHARGVARHRQFGVRTCVAHTTARPSQHDLDSTAVGRSRRTVRSTPIGVVHDSISLATGRSQKCQTTSSSRLALRRKAS